MQRETNPKQPTPKPTPVDDTSKIIPSMTAKTSNIGETDDTPPQFVVETYFLGTYSGKTEEHLFYFDRNLTTNKLSKFWDLGSVDKYLNETNQNGLLVKNGTLVVQKHHHRHRPFRYPERYVSNTAPVNPQTQVAITGLGDTVSISGETP
jgi:hypothetical protein